MRTPALSASSKALLCAAITLPLLLAGCAVDAGNSDDPTDQRGEEVISENANDKIAFDFFVSKGLSHVQAAGIVGNLDQESGMSPTISQYGGGPGRGIAQWSAGGRWDSSHDDNVAWYASAHGGSRYSLTMQLDFIWYELTEIGYGYSELKAATSVTAATEAFMDRYEICGACDASNRIAHAEAALSEFGGGGSTPPSSAPDACSESGGYCTETLQCDKGHWILRQDDSAACVGGYHNVAIACHEGDGYCTDTLQCENGIWVARLSDPHACTSGNW